jgi:hypothetical protein
MTRRWHAVLGSVVVGLIMLATVIPAVAQARPDLSRIRILAIAPFADEVSLSRPIAEYGASRLSELVAGRRYQAIPAARVADEMRRLGIAPRELISPTKTWMLGQALGADAVLTGRVTYLMHERDDSGPDGRRFGFAVTRVDVDIRVLDVASRVNVFQSTFMCERPWPSHAAMDCVVRDVAAALGAGRP